MNKRHILLFIILLPALNAFSQMYILNEDFNGASGTIPPAGWTNNIITGGADDKWHFDNPGQRILNYPVTHPFAIFDSDSTSANGQPEVVALVTPVFDASTSNFILLHFVHVFEPGTGGSATIEAYDGTAWNSIITFTSATLNPATEIADLSAAIGGVTNARLRFKWSGNGSGFWAIDNIRIYASLPVDGGVVSIDSPTSPVVPGIQNVEITLGNFGYNTLTSALIGWTADGVSQPPHNWNGSIGFGQTQSNIVIGTYNFQDPVLIKVWQSNPNGQNDLNPYNDTVTKYLVSPLCGTYTIGGTNPDFDSFTQAADVLNTAGITCPVTFLVRNGTYYEEFILKNIQGTSATNTITFRSESGDSSLAVIKIIPGALKFESMIYFDGSAYINFQDLGFSTGSSVSYANNALLLDGAKNINIQGCYFIIRNQFDFGIAMQGSSRDINIENSRFESISARAGAVNILESATTGINISGNTIKGAADWGYPTIKIGNSVKNIQLADNRIEQCYRAIYLIGSDSVSISGNLIDNSNDGIYIDNFCSYVEISGNRLTGIKSHPNVPEGTGGITVNNAANLDLYNNFIQTTGNGPVMGISLTKATFCRVSFNSINITNDDSQGRSNGIMLKEDNQVVARNNIFNALHNGSPISIEESQPMLDFDKNNYYNLEQTIGTYKGKRYTDLQTWIDSLGMDLNSLAVPPFFTSTTDLAINQVLLNNAGVTVPGITQDIDGTLRDPLNPDIGAKEYDLCSVDAGVNAVSGPQNPLNGGLQEVSVMLQNQGTSPISSVRLNWTANGLVQAPFNWSGNLAAGASLEVAIGNFDFQPGILYSITAWTENPDNLSDCNPENDTISSRTLAVPLCGTYTIGGNNPDLGGMQDAVTLLNLAGISCPVTFLLRDGTYFEQLVIKEIPGTSEINTVTFRSENGDSTLAVIKIDSSALKYESMIYLEASQHVIFRDLGFITGADVGFFNNAFLLEEAKYIEFEGCYFETRKESDLGITIQGGSQDISIRNSRFECNNYRASAIFISGDKTRDILIEGNQVMGTTDWGYMTIKAWDKAGKITLLGNHLDRCFRAIQLANIDSALVRGNVITASNDGVYLDDWCSHVEISGNRLSNIISHQNVPDGTSGIYADNSNDINIFNNFIQTAGSGPVLGISIQNSSLCRINFNSVNITNDDNQGKSKGIFLKSGSGITARNNIFNITHRGTPVYITAAIPQLDFNHNDYFSYDQTIGYFKGTRYTDLAAWKDSVNMDLNSLSVIPFFTSETDLSINQALLNNTGVPVAGITQDIDNTVRDPLNPDVGAKEYSLCSNDAGINAVLSPGNPLTGGIAAVNVLLQNQGTEALSSVKINWQVNTELQALYSWSGNLAAGANTTVNIGDYDFQGGPSYVIKAWTSEPDNATDCNHNNDTILSGELSGALCGTFTIGGNNPDFYTFSQVAEVLNSAGIACPVTFLVRDGIYFDRFILGDIKGSSEVNTITFRSESGDSTLAAIKLDPLALNYESMIYLNGTRHLILKGLGLFTGTSLSESNNALLLKNAGDIEISGCYFEVHNDSDLGIDITEGCSDVIISQSHFECTDYRAGAINIAGSQTRNMDISDNTIKGPDSWGYTLVKIGNEVRKVSVTGNIIENSFRSVYITGTDTVFFNRNELRNTNDGIYIDNQCSVVEISQNRLINIQGSQNSPSGTNGISVQNSSGVDIINNFIQTAGDAPVLGINLQNADTCRIYYNSVNTANTDPQGKSRGLYLKSCSQILARNNIFCVKNLGVPIHIDVGVTSLNIDYNNYFSPAGVIGKLLDQVYSNLFEWGQTINGDANSKTVNPYFKADTIPLPFQRILNGAGIPIAGILYDIDGKLRYSQAPDIGCMEFFVDYGILDLLSPTLNCFHSEMDSVIVLIRQFGDVPFADLKVAYRLDNGPVHIDTIPGPLITDVIHAFSTVENISAPGEYRFKIWLINTLDDNINNDTLIAIRYSKPPPVLSVEYDNFCTGWEVHFTGQATVPDPYFIASYEWIYGDGYSDTIQNPVHVFTEPGTYDVIFRAYSNAGCYSELITQVYIDPAFQGLQLGYDLVSETCLGDSTGVLEFLPTGGYPPYQYFINGTQVADALVTNLSAGVFEIKVVDSQNCTRLDTIVSSPVLDMHPLITANPLEGFTPLTVQFDFTADSAINWVWYFGEGQTDTNASTSHTFIEYGNHEVFLTVQSGPPHFCSQTTSVMIFVDMNITIEANNVFTPNNDGYNDFFEIKTAGVKEMDVNIFNQWGNKIYRIDKVDGKWDGNTEGGAKAPDGTYFWALEAKGVDDLIYERQGSVLLLRYGSAVYPNPVTDIVRVSTDVPFPGPVSVSVYSVMGQLAYSEIINDPGNIILDISGLNSGIYILKVSDGSLNSFARIIKN